MVSLRLKERFNVRRLLPGKLKLLPKLKLMEPNGPELMMLRLNELALTVVVELKLDEPRGPDRETLKLNVAGRMFVSGGRRGGGRNIGLGAMTSTARAAVATVPATNPSDRR
jgi:hypothetical protein